MDNFNNNPPGDAIVVGNTSTTRTAAVQLYYTPPGSHDEQPEEPLLMLPPGAAHTFLMSAPAIDKASRLRIGGAYRVDSSIPVVAYQHSPLGQNFTNDASMLFPEHALRQHYILAAYKASLTGYAGYFNVIAAVDGTTVQWTPTADTIAGQGVPAVLAGETGSVKMDRLDTLQVRAVELADLSGTALTADQPIWVVSAVECVNIPAGVSFCDHIEEQMLPLDVWGEKYVGVRSPPRGAEQHRWRVFSGADGVTIATSPLQPNFPIKLDRGHYYDLVLPHGQSVTWSADGPILPVQYLEGQAGGAGTGDPSMYQMVPVEQFLSAYAFVTGTNYPAHYVQVIRPLGGPDILLDGAVVGGYFNVGAYQVADVQVAEGAHFATSAEPFGIIGLGYSGATSYAYPGGLRLEVINPQ
jgi:hypothetical protein